MTYNQFLEFLAQAYDKFNTEHQNVSASGDAFMCYVLCNEVEFEEEGLVLSHFAQITGIEIVGVPREFIDKLRAIIFEYGFGEGQVVRRGWGSSAMHEFGIEDDPRQLNLHRPIWIRQQIK